MRLRSIVGLTALLGALTGPGSGLPAAARPAGEGAATEAWAADGRGFDPSVPVQESYRGWPPPQLLERFHALHWGPAAFRRAELFGRPVFLVLTVEWSQGARRLMKEVLADPEVARTLNQGYVSVLANADLRPEVQERYQTGAWPAMALLLPDGNPILSRVNDRGQAEPITSSTLDKETLLFLLREGAVYWRKWQGMLRESGRRWAREEGPELPAPGPVDSSSSERMVRWMLANADREEGSFGAAPKFLVPGLDEYAGAREARGLSGLRGHSRLTLERFVASPLYDGKEGGIHRLAALPGFEAVEREKLLTTNAAVIRELTWSLRGEDSKVLRGALRGTVEFVTGTLARPGGGFYFAQAALSASERGKGGPRRRGATLDRHVLSGPNAAAGAALVRAGVLLGDEKIVAAGVGALELVRTRAFRPGRGVLHAIEAAGEPGVYLATQAQVALAFLDAWETTGRRAYLDAGRDIVDFVVHNLGAAGEVVYRDHLADARPIGLLGNERRPLRGNVRLARAMLRLAYHGAGEGYRERAIRILENFCGDLSLFGVHGIEAALAVEEAITEPLMVEVGGPSDDPAARALRRTAVNASWPWTLVRSGPERGNAWAEGRWRGEVRRAADPEGLQAAIDELARADGS